MHNKIKSVLAHMYSTGIHRVAQKAWLSRFFQSATQWSLNFPPQHKYVATLPC